MASSNNSKCHEVFNSGYNKSSLFLLYGGMRKTLFVNKHPLDGVSAKNLGISVGKSFYDLNKQDLRYKDSNWRVKANLGNSQLFNMKMKIGEKTKGVTRNNIQIGTDESNFGSDKSKSNISVGGMFTTPLGSILAHTRLKVFSDRAAECYFEAGLPGNVQLAVDMRAEDKGAYAGYIGASAALPDVPVLKNLHVGAIVSLPAFRPSVGVFAEAPVPGTQKAVVGVEFAEAPRMTLIGIDVKLDNENSLNAKFGDNGIAQASFIKNFKGLDVRMGVEANVVEGTAGRFGVQVTLK